MAERAGLSVGDEWPHHYRGMSLQASPGGDVWWQLYQGTDRLRLNPAPEEVVDRLLTHKRIGGRFHVTERGDVLTRVEEGDGYEQRYLGRVDTLEGELVPDDAAEYKIDLQPDGLDPGDLWPSVYDGSRYSFVGDRFWWHSGQSHKRHPVPDGLPADVEQALRRYKPDGGSFRVLPWGDVITLVPLHPSPEKVESQFNELPRVVRNIIRLRKDRDVDMLPVYVGSVGDYPIEVEEPTSLSDKLSDEEEAALNSWAQSLGRTTRRRDSNHTVDSATDAGGPTDRDPGGEPTSASESEPDSEPGHGTVEGDETGQEEGDPPEFDDDPVDWIMDDLNGIDDPDRSDQSSG